MSSFESHFDRFRRNTVGYDHSFETPYGTKRLVYTDWIASGRLYRPIEEQITNVLGPFVGNTHSESSVTGSSMTRAYHEARNVIKRHVGAGPNDAIIAADSGMTGVVNKLQRILGMRIPERLLEYVHIPEEKRPVVFITHMEHHSNQTSWEETIADVVWIPPDDSGLCRPDHLAEVVEAYKDRPLIGSFTACSNVTGVRTPYHELARVMHENGGLCFVDFAASAPYESMNMHPEDPAEKLDAIFFSPHKFLGGPGSAGVMVFDRMLDHNVVPDHPGGGTVDWTNPWGEHRFRSDLEDREDGGTPPFLQTIRAALAIRLKEEMGTENIMAREEELLARAFPRLRAVRGLHILADHLEERLGVISFYVDDVHYNLLVKLLNDRFGIQMRGGCSCAGTYGHYLLHVDQAHSRSITDQIDLGDLSMKPGWVRFSIHPTTTDSELDYVLNAVEETVSQVEEWAKDYDYDSHINEFVHKADVDPLNETIKGWFELMSDPVSSTQG
ncbi:MAG: aminotransferase class V-fold PLP-dependent enzyme [Rhodothermia bacterium]|nr:MAG: aminotransferase class V-fold PLP-dependent enzyme [Rhodothermia bacterium]